MIQAEQFQGNQIYTVVLSIMLNSFPSMSLSLCSTVKQKVDKINSITFELCIFRAFLRNGRWIFIKPLDFFALHSVNKYNDFAFNSFQ